MVVTAFHLGTGDRCELTVMELVAERQGRNTRENDRNNPGNNGLPLIRGFEVVGRRELPLLADGTAVTDLAIRLRALRNQAGYTYAQLSPLTRYSIPVLQKACSGRTPPTWAVLAAFVTACGGDPTEWKVYLAAAINGGPAIEVAETEFGSSCPVLESREPEAPGGDDGNVPAPDAAVHRGHGQEGKPTSIENDRHAAAEVERSPPASRRRRWVTVGVLVAVAGLAAATTSFVLGVDMLTVNGRALCTSGANVVGVWIETSPSSSYSGLARLTANVSGETGFIATIPAGSAYAVHVGCGGDVNNWKISDYSDSTTKTSAAWVCDDTSSSATKPPFHGACRLNN